MDNNGPGTESLSRVYAPEHVNSPVPIKSKEREESVEERISTLSVSEKSASKVKVISDTQSMPAGGKLDSAWTLYCTGPADTTYTSRSQDIRSTQVAQFDTVSLFWGALNNIPAPSQLVSGTTYSLFRSVIQPRWEDSANECGGQWVMLIRNEEIKNKAAAMDALWELFACALVGEDVDGGSKGINGIVFKIRPRHFAVQIWTKSAVASTVRSIGEKLRTIALRHEPLQAISSLRLDFYMHQQIQQLNKKTPGVSRPQPQFQI